MSGGGGGEIVAEYDDGDATTVSSPYSATKATSQITGSQYWNLKRLPGRSPGSMLTKMAKGFMVAGIGVRSELLYKQGVVSPPARAN